MEEFVFTIHIELLLLQVTLPILIFSLNQKPTGKTLGVHFALISDVSFNFFFSSLKCVDADRGDRSVVRSFRQLFRFICRNRLVLRIWVCFIFKLF